LNLQDRKSYLIPIQDIQTCWNSIFLIFNCAKRLQSVYNRYCTDYQYLYFQLDPEKWRQIDYLFLFTKSFFDFTNILSKTKDITVYNIFSIYNKFFIYLNNIENKLKNKDIV